MRSLRRALALSSCLLLVGTMLAGCAGSSSDGVLLKTVHTASGDVVVDGTGHSVYMYTLDTRGTEGTACDQQCLGEWPPVTTTEENPRTIGLEAKVGEITAPNGERQLTLDGWPLYTFTGDTAPGMTNGQGVGGVWWLLDADGRRVTTLRRAPLPTASPQ